MPEKLANYPNLWHLTKKLAKFTNFTWFLPKNAPISHNNCPKNTFSRILGGKSPSPPSPTPMAGCCCKLPLYSVVDLWMTWIIMNSYVSNELSAFCWHDYAMPLRWQYCSWITDLPAVLILILIDILIALLLLFILNYYTYMLCIQFMAQNGLSCADVPLRNYSRWCAGDSHWVPRGWPVPIFFLFQRKLYNYPVHCFCSRISDWLHTGKEIQRFIVSSNWEKFW